MARLQRDFSNSRRERLRRRDVKLRVVDVNQKQKDVSSFVDIYNTKRWEIESPGNQTTGSRPAHDQLTTATSPTQTSIQGSRLMQCKSSAILVSAAKEIRLVEIYMLNMKVGSGVTLLIHLGE